MQTTLPSKPPVWRPFQSIGPLTPSGVGRDLAAGLTLAAIAVPEQMATARLGGFAPQLGLLAFVAGSLGFAAFGSSRQLSAGGDSTITPIFAGGLAALAATGAVAYGPAAALLAIMVGLLLVLAGVLRLGWMADLLSKPVLTGFLAGIALHIVLSQAPALLGLAEEQGDVYHRLASLWGQAHAIRLVPLAIGLCVFGLTFLFEKLSPQIPGALIALAAATVLTAGLKLENQGVAVLGRLTVSPHILSLPPVSLRQTLSLFSLAVVTALVVMVQTAATSRAFPPGGDPDVNRDYLGVGFAGVLAGLAGAFPVNASPPRTAVVFQAGGQSQLCGLAAAALVAALALFGADLLAGAPTCALAGVLLFVAQRIFRVRVFADLIGPSPAEFSLAALTGLLIFVLPIQTGVAIGVFLSLAHGVFTITRTQLIAFEHMPGGTIWWPASPSSHGETLPGVLVMGFQAPLSFLNAYVFRRAVMNAISSAPPGTRLFVLEAGGLAEIDYTASEVLREVIQSARKAGVDFAVARLESVRAQSAFDRFGVTEQLGRDHIYQSVDAAVQALAGPLQRSAH